MIVISASGASAQDVKKAYNTQRISGEAPRIDGKIDDTCWDQGTWGGGFTQRKPRGGDKPTFETEFKILYDSKYLYVAFKCYDEEPDKIERQFGGRDEFKGDMVGISFDSYFDKRTAFEFDITAAGGRIDMIGLENGKIWDFTFNAVWIGEAVITDFGWSAEIQILFSQLRYPDKEIHTWGLHVQRRIFRFEEEDNWNLIPIDAPGMVHLFGELHDIEGIHRSSSIELMPYFSTGKYSDIREVNDPTAANYTDRFHYYDENEISYDASTNIYSISSPKAPDIIQMDNPDLAFLELHSNFVFRWEYKPSSVLYFVWTHGRSEYQHVQGYNLSDAANSLFDIYPQNVFLIKLNYWFSF